MARQIAIIQNKTVNLDRRIAADLTDAHELIAAKDQRICSSPLGCGRIALACSTPPKGRARWTLRLLEKKVVELKIVDRASDSTIGRTLKKTFSSPIADSAGSFRRRPIARS